MKIISSDLLKQISGASTSVDRIPIPTELPGEDPEPGFRYEDPCPPNEGLDPYELPEPHDYDHMPQGFFEIPEY